MLNFFRRLLYWVFIGLPVASLALNAVAWLRFGLDLPLYDDWRGYASGQMHSLDFDYLFRPVNDTMTPVGFALDALAQRYLDGNSIAYQFLSLVVVLGGLLWLQWRLLRQALGDTQLAAICFVFTLLMLQPDSYWGQQNMAYHQALPLLFILSSLVLLLDESARDIWRMPLIMVLSLLAGFSYISGAFGVLSVGLALLLVCAAFHTFSFRHSLFCGGLLLTLSGGFSSAVQYWRAIPGLTTHKPDAPMAWPIETNFWMFFLGKVGRSLGLPPSQPTLALACILAISVMVFVLVLLLAARGKFKNIASPREYRVSVIFIVMAALIFVYLLLVSAGRSNLRPPDVKTSMQVFVYGFDRFHFFWATLLWPWFVAALIITWQAFRKSTPAKLERIVAALAVLLIPLMVASGVFSHASQYKAGTLYRLPTVSCLAEQLQRGDAIYCFEFFMPDFRAAYTYGRLTGASFVRHFPILPISLGTEDPAPWFRLTSDMATVNMHSITLGNRDKDFMLAGEDASMQFQTGKEVEMARCMLLDVNAKIQTTQPTTAQIFYRTLGQTNFSELESKRLGLPAITNISQNLRFQISSSTGFEDAFRFDPVDNAQAFNVLELEVRCRWSLPAP